MFEQESLFIFNLITTLNEHKSNIHEIQIGEELSSELREQVKSTRYMAVVQKVEPISIQVSSKTFVKWLITLTNGIVDIPVMLNKPFTEPLDLNQWDIIYISIDYIENINKKVVKKVEEKVDTEKKLSGSLIKGRDMSLSELKKEVDKLPNALIEGIYQEQLTDANLSTIIKVGNLIDYVDVSE